MIIKSNEYEDPMKKLNMEAYKARFFRPLPMKEHLWAESLYLFEKI